MLNSGESDGKKKGKKGTVFINRVSLLWGLGFWVYG